MNGQKETERNLIERILSALYIPESQSGQAEDSSFSNSSFLQTSLELKEFMNKMPGGFFVYRAEEGEEIL